MQGCHGYRRVPLWSRLRRRGVRPRRPSSDRTSLPSHPTGPCSRKSQSDHLLVPFFKECISPSVPLSLSPELANDQAGPSSVSTPSASSSRWPKPPPATTVRPPPLSSSPLTFQTTSIVHQLDDRRLHLSLGHRLPAPDAHLGPLPRPRFRHFPDAQFQDGKTPL